MAQGKILRLPPQPGSEARPQGMKQDANQSFHGMARLPAEGTNRNDFNAVGIIGMHSSHPREGRNLLRKLLKIRRQQMGFPPSRK
jgi:hypothetical protein